MELYGVQHGVSYLLGGMELAKTRVRPSWEMLDRIGGLPPGSKVGLETIPELLETEPESTLVFSDHDVDYWREIGDVCKAAGHEIIHLDSIDLHLASARKRHGVSDLEDALVAGEYSVTPGRERDFAEFKFAGLTAAQYIFEIEREDHIIRRLKETRPDLAVIGLAHGDNLMLTPPLPDEAGVDNYWRGIIEESPFDNWILLQAAEYGFMGQSVEQSPPDPRMLDEREQLTRVHRAVRLGRITTGGSPEFIGSWDTSCRPHGLFEVHAATRRGEQLTGCIEDMLGTATFEGEFGKDKIGFVKEYEPDGVLDDGAVRGEMTYEAERVSDDEFEGEWKLRGRTGGKFIIKRGAKLYEPADIYPFE